MADRRTNVIEVTYALYISLLAPMDSPYGYPFSK